MIVHSIFFYFFSVIAIFSSLMVITSRSTINSVFFLILDFISVGCLFIMVGAEFLGMIILIVYVGAVAVLFLFVVMMLNVAEQKQSWFIGKKSTHIPIGLIVSVLILLELLVVVGGWKYKSDLMSSSTLNLSDISRDQLNLLESNIKEIKEKIREIKNSYPWVWFHGSPKTKHEAIYDFLTQMKCFE